MVTTAQITIDASAAASGATALCPRSAPQSNRRVEGLTLREIGARLGVSCTALYRHFADKRALLAAVATEGFRTLRLHLVTAWEDGGRGRAAFESMGVAYVRFAVANPSHYRVMFGGFRRPEGVRPRTGRRSGGRLPGTRGRARRAAT